jgi:predicted nucleic acid-binding protein
MPQQVFIDTNIWVYSYDDRFPEKQQLARDLLEHLTLSENAYISTQVMQEFCSVMLTKVKTMDGDELIDVIETTLQPYLTHIPSTSFYQRGIRLYHSASLQFYDALIVQAALDLGCTTLYSEDLQHGQTFGSLTVVNPFFA